VATNNNNNNNNNNDDGVQTRRILCIGGGYDLGFLRALGSSGCARIVEFVRDTGGCYFGACAGAYFACDSIAFDSSGPLAVVGKRQLGFYRGRAVGPVNRRFAYNCHERAIPIRTRLSHPLLSSSFYHLYLNGGFYFEQNSSSSSSIVNDHDDDYKCRVLAYYDNDPVTQNDIGLNECLNTSPPNDVAIVATRVGRGRCLLSSVHFEFDAQRLAATLGEDAVTRDRLCAPMLDNNQLFLEAQRRLRDQSELSTLDLSPPPPPPPPISMHSNYYLGKYLLDEAFQF
jgi:biotin---protein ligase